MSESMLEKGQGLLMAEVFVSRLVFRGEFGVSCENVVRLGSRSIAVWMRLH